MSRISINKEFTMSRESLEEELNRLADELGREYQLNCEWLSDDCLEFKRSGINGQINIADEEVNLDIELGMLMTVFRDSIEKEVMAFMDQHIY